MSTDVANGMISVKDKEVMEKRQAFQKTIELHKKMQELQPSHIFKSIIERDCSAKAIPKSHTHDSERVSASYNPGTTMQSSIIKGGSAVTNTKDSFGVFNESHYMAMEQPKQTRQGQDPGYNMLLSEHIERPAFN